MGLRLHLAAGTIVLVCSAAFPASSQAGQLAQGLDPGTTVTLDLARGRFTSPLPFDVQFFVQGDVDDKATKISGKYITRSNSESCDDAFKRSAVSMGGGRFFTQASMRQFEVSVQAPGLSPNRDYCFEFDLAFKADEARLRQIVAEQFNLRLQEEYLNEDAVSTASGFERFRKGVRAAIDAETRKLEVETGMKLKPNFGDNSFFDLAVPSSAINPREQEEFTLLLQDHDNKRNAVIAFQQLTSIAADQLKALKAVPAFGTIVTQLRTNLGQPLVSLRLPNDGALRFASVPDDRLARWASGLAIDQSNPLEDVNRVWEATVLDARLTNLDATIRQVETFRAIVGDLVSLTTLRDAAELGPNLRQGGTNTNAVQPGQITAVLNRLQDANERGLLPTLKQVRGALQNVRTLLFERSNKITAAAARVTGDLIQGISIDGTTTASWETRAKAYVGADVGVAWSDPIQSFFFYVGANFYFGPVNKKAPLHWNEPGNFRKRFALMAGVPVNRFDDTQTVQLQAGNLGVNLDGVLGDRPLLLGAGLRLNELVRVTSGAVLFRVKSPNPLITNKSLDYSWFLAFSIDFDLKGMFSDFASQPPPKPAMPRVR